jgi:hypothetical protein
VIKTAAGLLVLFCIAEQSFPANVNVHVHGVIADASSHRPLSAASIIQDYPGNGGVMVQDSAFSDSLGDFQVGILDSNQFAPTLVVEKNGYKTQTVRVPAIDSPSGILLDTIFLVSYTQLDSVTYVISGAVTDTGEEGVRGAIVSIMLSRGAAMIFSREDTASQWGGYYNVSTRLPYQPSPLTVRLQVQMPGFFPADVSQTLPASTEDFVINLVLRRNPSSVMVPVARQLTKAIAPASRTYTVDGRLVSSARLRLCGMIVVRISPDGAGHTNILVK